MFAAQEVKKLYVSFSHGIDSSKSLKASLPELLASIIGTRHSLHRVRNNPSPGSEVLHNQNLQ